MLKLTLESFSINVFYKQVADPTRCRNCERRVWGRHGIMAEEDIFEVPEGLHWIRGKC
jgi:hypothetical protein